MMKEGFGMGQSFKQRRREEIVKIYSPKKEEPKAPKKTPSKPRQKRVKKDAE